MNIAEGTTSLSDEHFQRIIKIAAQDAGLAIPLSKKHLVQSRVTRRMRQIGSHDCSEYLRRLENDTGERGELICVLTTNVSHFYRENHHFEYIREHILSRPDPSKLRFWSAGCSNGQEPYTLAYEILKAIPDAAEKDILILASDIDPQVVQKAKKGLYSAAEIEGVPSSDRRTFFDEIDGSYQVRPELAKLIRFRQLNLNASSWPMKRCFDAILCRNVVIYFNDETQQALWPRFKAMLNPGGTLILGHSERIHPLENSGFQSVGVTTYRKI